MIVINIYTKSLCNKNATTHASPLALRPAPGLEEYQK